MFEHQAVTANEHGRSRPHDLPERIVPGHHRQHQAQRVINNAAVSGGAGHHLVRQKDRALLGIKIKVPGAFFNLAQRFTQGLAHFQGDDSGECLFLLAQCSSDFVQVGPARLHAELGPALLRLGRLRQLAVNLLLGVDCKLGKQLVGGGIDGGDHVRTS